MGTRGRINKLFRIALKVFAWALGGLLGLLLLIAMLLQLPPVQKKIASTAATYLSKTIGSKVEIYQVSLLFPKTVVVKELFVEDLQGDTLLYSHRFHVDVDLPALLNNSLKVKSIELSRATAHIYRSLPDSSFNFDFIIDAFAKSDSTALQPDTVSKNKGTWEISLQNLMLEQVNLSFLDETSQSSLVLALNNLNLEVDNMLLNRNTFDIRLLEIEGLNLDYLVEGPPKKTSNEKEETEYPELLLGLDRVNLNNIKANYINKSEGQELGLVLGSFGLDAANLNLQSQNIDAEEIFLNNTGIAFTIAPQPGVQKPDSLLEKTTDNKMKGEEEGWKLALNKINLDKINLVYDDNSEIEQESGIDFNHLEITGFEMQASGILYSDGEIMAGLEQLAFYEKSGFSIQEFSTQVNITEKRAQLSDFHLRTGSSTIAKHFELHYPSLSEIGKNLEDHAVDIRFDGTKVGISDLLLFMPELGNNPSLAAISHKQIDLDGNIQGPVGEIDIAHFSLKLDESTSLLVNGQVKGLPDAKNAHYNIETLKLATTQKDVRALVPDTLLPKNITIPGKIGLQAYFIGKPDNFKGKMDLNTSLGNVFAELQMKPGNEGIPVYNGDVSVEALQMGKLLKQNDLGSLDLTATIDGSGITTETIKADISANIIQAGYNNYSYENLSINGLYLHQQFNGTVKMQDENLDFEFAGLFDFREEFPDVKATLALKGVNLQALNFTKDDIRVQLLLNADIEGPNLDNLNGGIGIRNVIVIKNNESYRVDSLLFASITDDIRTNISIESDFLSAHLKGTIHPSDVGTAFQRHFNKFFSTATGENLPPEDSLNPQIFEFDLIVRDPVILTDLLVPGLNELRPVNIRGRFNSKQESFNLNMDMPLVVYEGNRLDSMRFDVFSKDGSMQFNLQLREIATSSFSIPNLGYTGNIASNTVLSKFTITETDGSIRVGIPLNARSLKDTMLVSFYPGDFILDYLVWKVPEDNAVLLVDKGFVVKNLVLERRGQFLAVNTKGNKPEDPLELTFKDFEIGNLSGFIEAGGDTLYRGILNGGAMLHNLQKDMVFTSGLKITDFSFKNDTVGNIALNANNVQKDIFAINATITGFGNNVALAGTYAQKTKSVKMNADIHNFELGSISAFLEDVFHSLDGSLQGSLSIGGTVENPDIIGEINIINASFNLVALNSYFTMPNERLVFDKRGIRFPSLAIRDTTGNKVMVNGYVLTDNYRDMEFDLGIRAKNFMALNRPKEQMDLYYGTIILDSDIKVRGDITKPIVDAKLGLLEGTALTLVIPETQVAMVEKEGIVEFVIIDDRSMSDIMDLENGARDTLKAEMRGIDLRANVSIDEETIFKIIIDESSGDFLEVKGGANISFGIDPGGAMTLTGSYEINKGQYQLSFYNLVKREFSIRPGSTITWKGDPLNAEVDISAIHTVRTSPAELMAGQATDEQTRRAMGNQLPFDVYLNMKGELLKPEIDFNIELPDDRKAAMNGTVNSRLMILNEQESELNKQVFALLILGRFIPEDPLDASGGGGLTATARSSASKLLTQQLNQLSGKYIKGVDLTFDVESYEDMGTAEGEGRTELQVGLSRAFLDDRLRVEVGGRVDLEGERRREQRNVSDIAGDVAVEYMLSEDGTYRLRGFRRNEFQMLLDGDVVETGLSFIFTRDFTRFRELLKKRNEKEKQMLPGLDDGALPQEEELIEIQEEDEVKPIGVYDGPE